MNHDIRPHTATADGGSFDTGSILRTARPGDVPDRRQFAYFCRIHPFMRGRSTSSRWCCPARPAPPAKGAAGAAQRAGRGRHRTS